MKIACFYSIDINTSCKFHKQAFLLDKTICFINKKPVYRVLAKHHSWTFDELGILLYRCCWGGVRSSNRLDESFSVKL